MYIQYIHTYIQKHTYVDNHTHVARIHLLVVVVGSVVVLVVVVNFVVVVVATYVRTCICTYMYIYFRLTPG